MAELLIRGLEITIVERLKTRAKEHKRSLQAELKSIVETAAKVYLEDAEKMSKTWRKALKGKSFSDSAQLLREDRAS